MPYWQILAGRPSTYVDRKLLKLLHSVVPIKRKSWVEISAECNDQTGTIYLIFFKGGDVVSVCVGEASYHNLRICTVSIGNECLQTKQGH